MYSERAGSDETGGFPTSIVTVYFFGRRTAIDRCRGPRPFRKARFVAVLARILGDLIPERVVICPSPPLEPCPCFSTKRMLTCYLRLVSTTFCPAKKLGLSFIVTLSPKFFGGNDFATANPISQLHTVDAPHKKFLSLALLPSRS